MPIRRKIFHKKDKPKKNNEQQTNGQVEQNKQTPLPSDIQTSIDIFKNRFNYPLNIDVKLREFTIKGLKQKAAIMYIDTIIDLNVVEAHVLNPLLTQDNNGKTIEDIISAPSMSSSSDITQLTDSITTGNAVLFIDGSSKAYVITAAKFEGRSVEQPQNEKIVTGPKEAFVEKATINMSLLRKKIKEKNLVFEAIKVSNRSENTIYLAYINEIVDKELIQNVKKRLNKIDADSVATLALLEQYIEDRKYSIFPTILNTERPDRAAAFLEEGHVALVMDNSPAALIAPATFWSFYHTSEDHMLRFIYGNFTRFLRLIALFITLLASSVYIALITFHVEMIPQDLLYSIAATRAQVPFPPLLELLMMELAFELIREAGLRVPTPIGPTIGIVGALILGQAAVEANIVSPVVVIVVALSGVTSFIIGDTSLNFAVRIGKFIVIFAAGFFGVLGITAVVSIGLFYLVSIKSFGVPYLAPYTPKYPSSGDTLFRKVLQAEVFRPGYLRPKDPYKK